MTTLRGSTAGAFTSNARTLTLPGGTVAGDIAVLFAYDGYVSPVISGITGWTSKTFVTGFGDGLYAYKVLTSADITAGSVTVTWSNSYAGYAALATVSATYLNVLTKSISTSNGDVSTGRSLGIPIKNTDTVLYWAFKRIDGSSPSVSIDRGTSVDASSVTNCGGAFRTESPGANAFVTVTATYPSGGNVEGIVAVVLSDTPLNGGSYDLSGVTGATPSGTALLYKGRQKAADDAAGVA